VCGISYAQTPTTTPIEYSVTPNPFGDEITIRVEGHCSFTLIDLSGRIVYKADLGNSANKLSLGSLAPASYIYIIKGEYGQLKTGRIIKDR
jgi:hypothetical protein